MTKIYIPYSVKNQKGSRYKLADNALTRFIIKTLAKFKMATKEPEFEYIREYRSISFDPSNVINEIMDYENLVYEFYNERCDTLFVGREYLNKIHTEMRDKSSHFAFNHQITGPNGQKILNLNLIYIPHMVGFMACRMGSIENYNLRKPGESITLSKETKKDPFDF
jgi:hypothetical protein